MLRNIYLSHYLSLYLSLYIYLSLPLPLYHSLSTLSFSMVPRSPPIWSRDWGPVLFLNKKEREIGRERESGKRVIERKR